MLISLIALVGETETSLLFWRTARQSRAVWSNNTIIVINPDEKWIARIFHRLLPCTLSPARSREWRPASAVSAVDVILSDGTVRAFRFAANVSNWCELFACLTLLISLSDRNKFRRTRTRALTHTRGRAGREMTAASHFGVDWCLWKSPA